MICRTHFLLVGLLLVALVSNIISSLAQTELKNPDQYIVETISAPMPLDPATNYQDFTSGLNELVYETLIDYAGASAINLVPCLATAWEITDGGLNYTFTLRQGVKYHDGSDFNAWTMKYSLDRAIIMNDWYGPSWMLAQVITGANDYQEVNDPNVSDALDYLTAGGITVEGPYQLRIELERAYSAFIYVLVTRVAAAVSPKAIIENMPLEYVADPSDDLWGQVPLTHWFPDLAATNDWSKLGLSSYQNGNASGVVPLSPVHSDQQHLWMATHAVGTGPYKLVSLVPEAEILFEKNLDWWGNFTPYSCDEIIIKTVSEVATRILDIRSGDADSVYVPTTNAEEIIDLTRFQTDGTLVVLADNPGIEVFISPTFDVKYISFNLNDSLPVDYIFEDKTKSTYNHTLWPRYAWNNTPSDLGYLGATAENPFTCLPFRRAFAQSFDYETFIDRVTNGFAERMEGVIPNGMFGHVEYLVDDGYLPKYNPTAAKTGFETVGWQGTITLVSNGGNEVQKEAYLLLKEAIDGMGVGITIDVQEFLWPNMFEWIIKKIPLIFSGWSPNYADPDNYCWFFLHSEGFYAPRQAYSNPELDDLITVAARELDLDIREAMYDQIERTVAQDYMIIYGYQATRFRVQREWLCLDLGSLNPMSKFENVERIGKGCIAGPPTTLSFTTTTTPSTTITTTEEPPISTEESTTAITSTPTITYLFTLITPAFPFPSLLAAVLTLAGLRFLKKQSLVHNIFSDNSKIKSK